MVKKYPEYNRSTLQKFISSGFVKVNKEVVKKANLKFREDVNIELSVPEAQKNATLEPETIYEDKNVLVLDKPAGLLSMAKGEYCPEKTLEDYGLLVHRLDRGTSGVVILAKNPETQKFLRKQFQDRKTHKTYYAVVEGRPKLDEARIDLPIARDLKHPTTFRVDPNGKPSETFYKVIKSNDKYSLLELRPTTGRTHQLRVHLKYLGHPIIGDPVYGSKNAPRLYLHAKELEITLPGGDRRIFEAKLPQEFNDVF
jgi:RluA family pseudouridine synthase